MKTLFTSFWSRRLPLLLMAIFASLFCGCYITSLHPLFTKEDLVFEPALIGVWKTDEPNSTESWTVEKASEKGYYITMDSDSYSSLLTAHVAKLGTNLFLNLRISKNGMREVREMEGPYMTFLVPTFIFAKISKIEPDLEIAVLDTGKTREFLEKNRTALRHEVIENDQVVITASTKEIQNFLLKTANDAGLFGAPKKLKKMPDSPNDSKKL